MFLRSTLQVSAAIFFGCFLLLGLGCGEKNNTQQQADAKAEQYLNLIKEEKLQQAATLFGPKLKENALVSLQSRSKKLGRMIAYKLISKEINTVYSGKYFIYEFTSEYEKYTAVDAKYARHYATDVLTLFYSLSNDTLSVVSHMSESDGLHN